MIDKEEHRKRVLQIVNLIFDQLDTSVLGVDVSFTFFDLDVEEDRKDGFLSDTTVDDILGDKDN